MKRTAGNPASPLQSVHANASSTKRPKRKWKPAHEYDRSMRAYEQNPRAVRCNPEDDLGYTVCDRCGSMKAEFYEPTSFKCPDCPSTACWWFPASRRAAAQTLAAQIAGKRA